MAFQLPRGTPRRTFPTAPWRTSSAEPARPPITLRLGEAHRELGVPQSYKEQISAEEFFYQRDFGTAFFSSGTRPSVHQAGAGWGSPVDSRAALNRRALVLKRGRPGWICGQFRGMLSESGASRRRNRDGASPKNPRRETIDTQKMLDKRYDLT